MRGQPWRATNTSSALPTLIHLDGCAQLLQLSRTLAARILIREVPNADSKVGEMSRIEWEATVTVTRIAIPRLVPRTNDCPLATHWDPDLRSVMLIEVLVCTRDMRNAIVAVSSSNYGVVDCRI